MSTRDTIRAALVSAARSLGAPDDLDPVMERPKDPSHGDWATNVAMTLARPLRRKPADIARDLVAKLDLAAAGIERVEIAGPGFINFHVAAGTTAGALGDILARGPTYGSSNAGANCPVNVEFVSAAGVDYSLLAEPEEQELIESLLDFPALVAGAAQALEPHRVAGYLHETARLAQLWYPQAPRAQQAGRDHGGATGAGARHADRFAQCPGTPGALGARANVERPRCSAS
ncbi:MAG TPA: DALR anticodon-binding domain-containing protein [Gemmatimonadaceae bacterium]|nr:DALR anticodon-binding domain-containing protein [Gemmatimonadaceae bacterium]